MVVIADGANSDAIRLSNAIYSELERIKVKMEELNTLSSRVFYIIFIGQLIIFIVFQSFDVISEEEECHETNSIINYLCNIWIFRNRWRSISISS